MIENGKLVRDDQAVERVRTRLNTNRLAKGRELAVAFWNAEASNYQTRAEKSQKLRERLVACFGGRAPEDLESVDQYFNGEMRAALLLLLGEVKVQEIEAICRMRMEGIYSPTRYRRSYRSKRAGDYTALFSTLIEHAIHNIGYEIDLHAALSTPGLNLQNVYMVADQIALALRRGAPQVKSDLTEIILGDNQGALLSRAMISGIIRSGDREMVELVGRLLLAAKQQEGLRQQILESMDDGSIETSAYFLGLIEEHDLTRFSSVIRALDVWTGLGYGDAKPAVVKKCVQLAGQSLVSETWCLEKVGSADVLEIYFALWGLANRDVNRAAAIVEQMMKGALRYQKLAGLYFLAHADHERLRRELAFRYLEEEDLEVQAWLHLGLPVIREVFSLYAWKQKERDKTFPDPYFPTCTPEREALFDRMDAALVRLGNKARTFEQSVFPWCQITLDNTRLVSSMLSLAAAHPRREWIDRLKERLAYMNGDQRQVFYVYLLKPEKEPEDQAFLRTCLKDRSVTNRETVAQILGECKLQEADLEALAALMASKSGSLKKQVMQVFRAQSPKAMEPTVRKMLQAKEEGQVQAAMELLEGWQEAAPEQYGRLVELARERQGDYSSQTEILLKKMTEEKKEWTRDNGFGLFDPAMPLLTQAGAEQFAEPAPREAALEPQKKPGFLRSLFGGRAGAKPDGEAPVFDVLKEVKLDRETAKRLFEALEKVITDHADYEYETVSWNGQREKVVLGAVTYGVPTLPAEDGKFRRYQSMKERRLAYYPLAEEWEKAVFSCVKDAKALAVLLSYSWNGSHTADQLEDWFKKMLPDDMIYGGKNWVAERMGQDANRRWMALKTMAEVVLREQWGPELFEYSFRVYQELVKLIPQEKWGESQLKEAYRYQRYYTSSGMQVSLKSIAIGHNYLTYWRDLAKSCITDDVSFARYFKEMWRQYVLSGRQKAIGLGREDFLRAHDLGLIPAGVIYEELTCGADAADNIRIMTGKKWNQSIMEQYPAAAEFTRAVVNRVLEIESSRGELATDVTHLARNIQYLEGAPIFAKLLAALGKESFERGYGWGGDTKKSTLSRLLKRCYPAKDETAEDLRAALAPYKIAEKRLAEAAMYAPQWAGFMEQVLGWKGFKCGVWFFHAHINEHFTAEKETEVALYSPVTPHQFNDGTFDKEWFYEAWNTLGEKRFDILYKCAKYITSGSNQHRRSQLYTDAVLGRLDKAELLAEIQAKRNQEKLRCYPLLPMDPMDAAEALARYEFINQFKKESRQFGSQRKESEGRACRIALENLAQTLGFGDVDRMIWYLESEKAEELKPKLQPRAIGAFEVCLVIDENGAADIRVTKDGKERKTMPKEIAKDAYVLELKEDVKACRDQRSRAAKSLEEAMIAELPLVGKEVLGLLRNPVLQSMVERLVWVTGDRVGFLELATSEDTEPTGAVLVEIDGERHTVGEETTLQVVHPYRLYEQGVWSAWQQLVYERQICQPFKQVFREIYPLTEEERQAGSMTRRYAGHQVQAAKTVALLKSRGWTVDYEEGLQKVYYRDDIVVRMYAMADWFTPAEIEPPTLEQVRFYDRKEGTPFDLADVPPVLFSETMRDLDLVVSVAHVGGVDPEASQSTVEMRIAIAGELLKLLKITNVTFTKAHARIVGSLGTYSVHMGSGQVFADGSGAILVVPVHSQQRGRLFLPFADDDPKTAEIMSKILLFAEDKKIKDPSILQQIR